MIPYSHQSINEDDIRVVVRVLKSDWLTQGPTVGEFEKRLARFVGSRFAVVFSSGTAALQAAYFAVGIGKGDEIITTPLTFAATANAALWQDAKVVFADIEEDTGNIDPTEVEKKITKHTKAIVPVDYAGLPAKLGELKKIAKRHKLILIEDAAHAFGAEYKGKKIGSISDMTMFSFHPVKSITTGEGGAITTNRKDFYERLILFRDHGIVKDAQKFIKKSPGDWYQEMQKLGLNYRLTDIQAALGVSQLKRLPEFLRKRRAIAARYQKELAGMPHLIVPREPKGFRSSWHLFPLRLAGKLKNKRAEVFRKLRSAGIGVQVHYIPVYRHPYYQKLGYRKKLCPKAEKFYESEISIPLFPTLALKDQIRIIRLLKSEFAAI